jgi:hypothetical protein
MPSLGRALGDSYTAARLPSLHDHKPDINHFDSVYSDRFAARVGDCGCCPSREKTCEGTAWLGSGLATRVVAFPDAP